MFDLLRFISEYLFGSSLSLSHESFEYLSSNLHSILLQLIQQSFLITLRSKRTRLLGDDFQLILKYRLISPLFGYCCSSTTNKRPLFQTLRQDGRILFFENNKNNSYRNQLNKKYILSSNDFNLHVEWLAIDGEQQYSQINTFQFNKSLLNIEQKLYFEFFQSKNFNKNIWNFLQNDHISLNTILSNLIHWCRNNICECLQHSCQLKKRCQLVHYLTIIDCLLENSSIAINHYLHILSPIIITCLLYEYEINESLDFDEKSIVDTGDVWSIRLLSSKICIKILKRSNCFIYDIFYIRIISRLIYSLINSNSSSSILYSILYLFEQLGSHVCRTFLLPYLLDIDSTKILSSKSIIQILERIATLIIEIKID